MKQFQLTLKIETDDSWVNGDVKDMLEVILDPIYHLGDINTGEMNVEEIEVEE